MKNRSEDIGIIQILKKSQMKFLELSQLDDFLMVIYKHISAIRKHHR
jgi:hypothetical protein